MLKRLVLFPLSMLISYCSLAQNVTSSPPLPDWVAMIDNPNTNYYTAIAAFDTYWKDKVKPTEEMETGDEAEEEKHELENYLSTLSTTERNEWDRLQYHYKRFLRWKGDVFPFVQSDGRILTEEERLQIWQKQQEEIKNLKK